jgi:hypothetical protein
LFDVKRRHTWPLDHCGVVKNPGWILIVKLIEFSWNWLQDNDQILRLITVEVSGDEVWFMGTSENRRVFEDAFDSRLNLTGFGRQIR